MKNPLYSSFAIAALLLALIVIAVTSPASAFNKRSRNGNTVKSNSQKSWTKPTAAEIEEQKRRDATLDGSENYNFLPITRPFEIAYPSRIHSLTVTADIILPQGVGYHPLNDHCSIISRSAPYDISLKGAELVISTTLLQVRDFDEYPMPYAVGLAVANSSLISVINCRPGRIEVVVPVGQPMPKGMSPSKRYRYITTDEDIARHLDGLMVLNLR